MIFITPVAGLGNRMRALDSALALGRAAGVPVRMYWPLNEDLNCPFELLFDTLPSLDRFENREEETRPPVSEAATATRELAKRVAPLVSVVKAARKIRKLAQNTDRKNRWVGEEDTESCLENPEKLIDMATKYDMHICNYRRFFHGEEDFLGFRPTPDLSKRIESFSLGDRNVVGVHIRLGHEPSRLRSPLQGFISSMRARRDSDPTLVFFVASDSNEVEARLETEFPECILKQPNKIRSRNDPEGIKEAIVDMFCLASCKSMIGSYDSSFSETARDIGKIPCDTIDTEQK